MTSAGGVGILCFGIISGGYPMARRGLLVQSSDFVGVRERFDEWRRDRSSGSRIPKPLWDSATRLARAHGISPVARALRLDYYSLKRHLDGARGNGASPRSGRPLFFELESGNLPGLEEYRVELEAPSGAKMTIRLPRAANFELVSLVEAFWKRRR